MENTKEKNDSLTLKDIVMLLWNNIVLLASIIVGVTVLSIIFALAFIKPKFQATSSLYVDPTKFNTSSQSTDVAAALRATGTIADWVQEDDVIEKTIEVLNLKDTYTITSFRSLVTVTKTTDTLVIKVSVTSKDEDFAIKAVNALVESGVELANEVNPETDKPVNNVVYNGYYIGSEASYTKNVGTSKKLIVLVGFVAGIVIACAVVFLKEALKTKIKTEKDIEDNFNLRLIGAQINDEEFKNDPEASKRVNKENYERLLTNIDFSNVDNNLKVVEFTSVEAADGKSTTVLNLAHTMSDANRKCLVIDLDLRKPMAHRYFKAEKHNGVSEYVTGKINKADAIKHIDENVDLITAGAKVPNPIIILQSDKLAKLIEELKDKYDYIFLDCPPAFASSDAKLITKLSDGQVFIMSANQTKISLAKKTLKDFEDETTNILGVNLTKLKVKANKYYNYYYSRYYGTEEKETEVSTKQDSTNKETENKEE